MQHCHAHIGVCYASEYLVVLIQYYTHSLEIRTRTFSLKTVNCHHANFVTTVGTGDCHEENFRWWQNWYRDDSRDYVQDRLQNVGFLAPATWWRHPMETFSALLAICAGNSPVTGEFPPQRPVTQSFDVFFDLCLNKRLSKHNCEAGDLRRQRVHYDVTVMKSQNTIYPINYGSSVVVFS